MKANAPIFPKTYVPAPGEVPEWFRLALRDFGGVNPFGEDNYRVSWGMDIRGFINGEPRAIRYMNPSDDRLGWACFMLERWATPEFFNKTVWETLRFDKDTAGTDKTIDYLGPFPNRGEYILVGPLISDDEDMPEMLTLSQKLLDELLARLTKGSQRSSDLGLLEMRRRLKQAKSRAKVQTQLDERRDYYNNHAAEINAKHSREYVGLLEGRAKTPVLNLVPPTPQSAA